MMSCEQQKKCYLYFFGELTDSEKRAFKKHIKGCTHCRVELERVKNVWENIKEIPLEKPSSEISRKILQRAQQAKEKKIFFNGVREWLACLWMDYRKPVSIAAAVSLLVLVVMLSPLKQIMFSDLNNMISTNWDDDFMVQVDHIESSLDWIESEDFSQVLESIGDGEDMLEEDDLTSPLMKELHSIERSLEYINQI